jgi:Tfp pilus assembly protein PilF
MLAHAAADRWRLQSVLLRMRKQDFAGALHNLEPLISKRQSLRRDDRLSTVRFAAECYQAVGDNKTAGDFYREWIKEAPNDPTCLNNYACLLAENPRQLEEARTYSQRAFDWCTKYNTPDPLIYDTHGWIMSQMSGTYSNEGLAILEKLVEDHHEMIEGHYHLAMVYLKRNRTKDALTQLNLAMEQIKKNQPLKLSVRPQIKAKVEAELEKLKKNSFR